MHSRAHQQSVATFSSRSPACTSINSPSAVSSFIATVIGQVSASDRSRSIHFAYVRNSGCLAIAMLLDIPIPEVFKNCSCTLNDRRYAAFCLRAGFTVFSPLSHVIRHRWIQALSVMRRRAPAISATVSGQNASLARADRECLARSSKLHEPETRSRAPRLRTPPIAPVRVSHSFEPIEKAAPRGACEFRNKKPDSPGIAVHRGGAHARKWRC
jgi:hypothetical protein